MYVPLHATVLHVVKIYSCSMRNEEANMELEKNTTYNLLCTDIFDILTLVYFDVT